MENESPTHEEIQVYIRRAHQARSIDLAELVARRIDAAGPLIRKSLAISGTALAVLVAGVFVQADTSTPTRPGGFATACAQREAALITTAQSRDEDITAALAQTGLKLMTARSHCFDGKVDEAVALYDELIRRMAALPQSRVTNGAE